MNRSGFTAIMDATFFIILIGIAMTVLVELGEGEVSGPDDSPDVVGTLMGAEMPCSSFGYDDGKVMKVSDVAALSLKYGDGRISEYLCGYLDAMYPWGGSYALVMKYCGMTETYGTVSEDWHCRSEHSYDVLYGGELSVTLYLYD